MYSTVLGISANSNYRPRSRSKPKQKQAAQHSLWSTMRQPSKQQRQRQLHSSPSLESPRKREVEKWDEPRPSHRRSATQVLNTEHSGSTPTNEHFNRLLLSQHAVDGSYSDELKTERRFFNSEGQVEQGEGGGVESSAERSPPQPHKLQTFDHLLLKVAPLPDENQHNISDVIPDFLQDKPPTPRQAQQQAPDSRASTPLTSCYSYSSIGPHCGNKFRPAVRYPIRDRTPPPHELREQQSDTIEQLRERIASQRLIDRERARAQYKQAKRRSTVNFNLSRSDFSTEQLSQTLDTARRSSQALHFKKFVRSGTSQDNTPSPFQNIKTTPNSGCSEFKFQADVSPSQLRKSRLQVILENKAGQCQEVKDVVRESVQSVNKMLNDSSARRLRSRSLSTNGMALPSSPFEISDREPGEQAFQQEISSPYFNRHQAQAHAQAQGAAHPSPSRQHSFCSLSYLQEEQKGGAGAGSASWRAIAVSQQQEKQQLVRSKSSIRQRVQEHKAKIAIASGKRVRHMFRGAGAAESSVSPREIASSISRSSTPASCYVKQGLSRSTTTMTMTTTARKPGMKPEMRQAIARIESTMLGQSKCYQQGQAGGGRSKTPVRQQLKGEMQTALVKRGVGAASTTTSTKHNYAKQEQKKKLAKQQANSTLQARKNYGKTLALRNHFQQIVKLPLRKLLRRYQNYEHIMHFCYRRAVWKIEAAFVKLKAKRRIARALVRYVRRWRHYRRVLEHFSAFQPQIVKIQRWVRKCKVEALKPKQKGLNIRRFKELMNAVLQGWRVRKVLASAGEVQSLVKKVKDTSQLLEELRRDKTPSSRMFMRNVKRQHTPAVKALAQAVAKSLQTKSWLKPAVSKKTRTPGGGASKHQRELSKYGVRDRSGVQVQQQPKRPISRCQTGGAGAGVVAAVQKRGEWKKNITRKELSIVDPNSNQHQQQSYSLLAHKSPKSPSGTTLGRTILFGKNTPTPTAPGKVERVAARKEKKQNQLHRRDEKAAAQSGKARGGQQAKQLNTSIISTGSSSQQQQKEEEILGQISSLFAVIKGKVKDKATAESEFKSLMDELQAELSRHMET